MDQLVEIVSVIGPMTASDFDMMGIDESFPLVEFVSKQQNFSAPRSNLSERLRANMPNVQLDDNLISLFANVFQYIPQRRWDAQQCLHYVQWTL